MPFPVCRAQTAAIAESLVKFALDGLLPVGVESGVTHRMNE
jgi:hypothetical protein